jgi:hypothetical protein
MITFKRKRIRMHLLDERGSQLPSIEGVLTGRGAEYLITVPKLLHAAGGNPAVLEARYVCVPRERIAFYEVLS